MSTQPKKPMTVDELAALVGSWPRKRSDGTPTIIFACGTFPELYLRPDPVLYVGTIENEGQPGQDLVLLPEARALPQPVAGTAATALDLALEALLYPLQTPFVEYDPDCANQLVLRAVTAIEKVQHIKGGFAL